MNMPDTTEHTLDASNLGQIWDTHELDSIKFGTPMNWIVSMGSDSIDFEVNHAR